ncbi:DUF6479 family protein [Streptomyces sp. RB6PN25]|uniref:DUF6479 family protein n=1 Tax=Streptomyces humicola TaxID=2953240 RepID=A0ABT1PVP2_9ACTN|nr:DUF6479 family protein [Streptomyces humicola]MCQ4081714.1 DUF6479 family protein [Streptomyces humicola]
MVTISAMYAAAGGSFDAGPLLMGIALVVGLGLVGIFYGWLRSGPQRSRPSRLKEPQPRAGAWQTPDELGQEPPADHGPGHQEGEPVEYEKGSSPPEEVPHDGRRRMPYELRDSYPGPRH